MTTGDPEPWPPVTDADLELTDLVAMAVHDALEDWHAAGNGDFAQMAVINEITANAILTALYAVSNSDDRRCQAFVRSLESPGRANRPRPKLLERLTRITGA